MARSKEAERRGLRTVDGRNTDFHGDKRGCLGQQPGEEKRGNKMAHQMDEIGGESKCDAHKHTHLHALFLRQLPSIHLPNTQSRETHPLNPPHPNNLSDGCFGWPLCVCEGQEGECEGRISQKRSRRRKGEEMHSP